jgi:acetyl esterase
MLHGGGFWAGSVDNVDWLARHYAAKADCVVLSVDYRQPPDHPWPTANEDVYAVLQWAVAHGEAIGADPSRLAVGGVSAGGCIAASVALLARDRGGPSLCFQLLEIPMTDLTMSQPSITKFASGYLLTKSDIAESYDLYVPDVARRSHPEVSPFFAELGGLPPTYVVTCQYDPLRDEGAAYARRLGAAGVPAEHWEARGMVHSTNYLVRLKSARRSVEKSAAALRAALHSS